MTDPNEYRLALRIIAEAEVIKADDAERRKQMQADIRDALQGMRFRLKQHPPTNGHILVLPEEG